MVFSDEYKILIKKLWSAEGI